MADITTIEIKKTTHSKLASIRGGGESFDAVVNKLLKDREEVEKYISEYIKSKHGGCVAETVLGRAVFANHHIVGDTCVKCGAQSLHAWDDNGTIKVGATYPRTGDRS